MSAQSSMTEAMYTGRFSQGQSSGSCSGSDLDSQSDTDVPDSYFTVEQDTEMDLQVQVLTGDETVDQLEAEASMQSPSPSLAIRQPTPPPSPERESGGLRRRLNKVADAVKEKTFSDEGGGIYDTSKPLFASRKDAAKKLLLWAKWCGLYAFYCVAVLLVMFAVAPSTTERPWMSCCKLTEKGLWSEVKRVSEKTQEAPHFKPWCNTRLTKFILPCVCCIDKSNCFRSVHIHNATAENVRQATVRDVVLSPNGTAVYEMSRRVPTAIKVCAVKLHARDQTIGPDVCFEVDGPQVATYLRMEEMLKGDAFSGDIISSSPLPVQ